MLQYKIRKEYTLHPFCGYRKIHQALFRNGEKVTIKQIRRIMKKMKLKAVAPGPNTSKPVNSHKKYPYLLKDLSIEYINQVWATDITYIRLNGSFVYLVAVIDLYSRKVLSWSRNSLASDYSWSGGNSYHPYAKEIIPSNYPYDSGASNNYDEYFLGTKRTHFRNPGYQYLFWETAMEGQASWCATSGTNNPLLLGDILCTGEILTFPLCLISRHKKLKIPTACGITHLFPYIPQIMECILSGIPAKAESAILSLLAAIVRGFYISDKKMRFIKEHTLKTKVAILHLLRPYPILKSHC